MADSESNNVISLQLDDEGNFLEEIENFDDIPTNSSGKFDSFEPWDVKNLDEFAIFKCPECDFVGKNRLIFRNHAISQHPKVRRDDFLEFFAIEV
jgi:hypothetical protein